MSLTVTFLYPKTYHRSYRSSSTLPMSSSSNIWLNLFSYTTPRGLVISRVDTRGHGALVHGRGTYPSSREVRSFVRLYGSF